MEHLNGYNREKNSCLKSHQGTFACVLINHNFPWLCYPICCCPYQLRQKIRHQHFLHSFFQWFGNLLFPDLWASRKIVNPSEGPSRKPMKSTFTSKDCAWQSNHSFCWVTINWDSHFRQPDWRHPSFALFEHWIRTCLHLEYNLFLCLKRTRPQHENSLSPESSLTGSCRCYKSVRFPWCHRSLERMA